MGIPTNFKASYISIESPLSSHQRNLEELPTEHHLHLPPNLSKNWHEPLYLPLSTLCLKQQHHIWNLYLSFSQISASKLPGLFQPYSRPFWLVKLRSKFFRKWAKKCSLKKVLNPTKLTFPPKAFS